MTQTFAKMVLDKAPQRSLDQCLEIGQILLFRNFAFPNENSSIIVKTKKHYEPQCMKTLPQAQSSTFPHIKERLNPHLELHLHHLNRIRDFNLAKARSP